MALTIVFMSVIWLFKCKITYFLSFCKVFFAIFVKHEAKVVAFPEDPQDAGDKVRMKRHFLGKRLFISLLDSAE